MSNINKIVGSNESVWDGHVVQGSQRHAARAAGKDAGQYGLQHGDEPAAARHEPEAAGNNGNTEWQLFPGTKGYDDGTAAD